MYGLTVTLDFYFFLARLNTQTVDFLITCTCNLPCYDTKLDSLEVTGLLGVYK